jgi:lipopolysaccharide transport system ATP-binding protein
MKPVIEIHNIAKRYSIRHQMGYLSFRERVLGMFQPGVGSREDFWALQDVSFDVHQGESIGIIGRNGAGKSTLLKILSRIIPPTTGKITARGRVASLLEVGTGFHPELTGRENVFFNGSLLGMKRREIQSKFDEIVDFGGVEKFLDTPLKHYSSGMQLRLAFAVAAFLEPEILVIDEVLAVGDAEFQKKCLRKMEDVSRSGRTIFFVSHNMGAIKNLCSRALVLEAGRIALSSQTDMAIARYLSPSTTEDVRFLKPSNAPLWIETANLVGISGGTDFYYGDDLTFKLVCGAVQQIEAFVGFTIASSDGERLLCANNRYQEARAILNERGTTEITCRLGNVPLLEGSYHVNLYLGDSSKDHHIVENAFQFRVHERDIWGNGKVPPKTAAKMWWPTQFDLKA